MQSPKQNAHARFTRKIDKQPGKQKTAHPSRKFKNRSQEEVSLGTPEIKNPTRSRNLNRLQACVL